MAKVRFEFSDQSREVNVDPKTSLLEAAAKAGIQLNSICGGDGICGRCRVIVEKGDVSATSTTLLSREEIRQGYALACQTRVENDVQVTIPPETLPQKGQILIDEDAQRFKALQAGAEEVFYQHYPLTNKLQLNLSPPTLQDNVSDHQRVYRAVRRKLDIPIMQTGLKTLRKFSPLLRKNNWNVSVTLGQRGDTTELLQIESPDHTKRNFGVAVDVGTTTVVAHLVDLNEAQTVDAEARYNSQISYGEEVTRRMIYAEQNDSRKLQEAIVKDINQLISALISRNQVELNQVTAVICSGNTAMLHFLLGLETSNIRKNPYVPLSTSPPPVRAAEIGIKINPRGLLYSLPSIGGWVGGDVTGGITACGIHRSKELKMFIDIGTNGEIVIGNEEWLLSCSASAGPAFEGAGVTNGMRASQGAIEGAQFKNGELRISVIGNCKPKGICGSGLIDLTAEMFRVGIINRSGKLNPDSTDRVVEQEGELCFIVATESQSMTGEKILITQPDIENLIRAKAAIYAGAKIMLDSLDLNFSDVTEILIAGGFGSYLNRENAITLGLLPDLPMERINFVGNTSITGSKMALLSQKALQETNEVANSVTYYDLIDNPDYFEQFTAAKFLPHTNQEQFPSVSTTGGRNERKE